MSYQREKDDSWLGIYWKSAAAIVYLLICLFDFVAVPTYLGMFSEPLGQLILAIKDLPPDVQTVILTMKLATWEPLTLKGGGLFHVAFGAILGATAWGRSQERINEIRQGLLPGDSNLVQQVQPVQPSPVVEINNQVQNPGAQVDNPEQQG